MAKTSRVVISPEIQALLSRPNVSIYFATCTIVHRLYTLNVYLNATRNCRNVNTEQPSSDRPSIKFN